MTYMLDTNICIYVMKNKPEKVLRPVPRGAGRRALHFLYHAGRIGVWHEA